MATQCKDNYHESLRRTAARGLGWSCDKDVFFNCLICKSTLMIPADEDDEVTAVDLVAQLPMVEMREFDRNKTTVRIRTLKEKV